MVAPGQVHALHLAQHPLNFSVGSHQFAPLILHHSASFLGAVVLQARQIYQMLVRKTPLSLACSILMEVEI